MKRLFALPLLAAGLAAAGPYDQAYSIIATDEIRSADPNVKKVIVNRVDGENAMERNKAVVAPGAHKVTVDLPPREGFHLATQNTFDLTTKPCTRYNVAAKLDHALSQKWTPIVRSEERIVECEARFKGPEKR